MGYNFVLDLRFEVEALAVDAEGVRVVVKLLGIVGYSMEVG